MKLLSFLLCTSDSEQEYCDKKKSILITLSGHTTMETS